MKHFILLFCFALCSYSLYAREIILNNNKGIQEQMCRPNATYVVRSGLSLKNKTVQIPSGCTLKIQSGGVFDGILVGQNTRIKVGEKVKIGVILRGTWQAPRIDDSCFDANQLTDSQIITNINALQSDDVDNTIILSKPEYLIEIKQNKGKGLILSSNTHLVCSSIIKLLANEWTHYYIVYISGKENVSVDGGEIIGDAEDHYSIPNSTSEWGMGILISESSSVSVQNVSISRCIGDGIYVSGHSTGGIEDFSKASRDISIVNVTCQGNRRQEISLIHVDGIRISDSRFWKVDESGGTGIDIEPNKGLSVRNVTIDNCDCRSLKGCSLSSYCANRDGEVSVFEDIIISNSSFDGLVQVATPGLSFYNCTLSSLVIRNVETWVETAFHNCKIKNTDGINLYCSYSTKTHKPSRKNHKFNVLFDRCVIISGSSHPSSSKGLIFFTGKDRNISGSLKFTNTYLRIDSAMTSDYSLLANNHVENVEFDGCNIIMDNHVLESKGFRFFNNTIICDYIILDGSTPNSVFRKCQIQVSKESDFIFKYHSNVTSQKYGFEITNCTSESRSKVLSNPLAIPKSKIIARNNFFVNDNIGVLNGK